MENRVRSIGRWCCGLALAALAVSQPLAAQGLSFVYYYPHLAVGGEWQTTLTLINYSNEEVTCETDFLSDSGSPLMVSFGGEVVVSRTDVIPARGSVHEETTADRDAPTEQGWAQSRCSSQIKASLLFRRSDSQGVALAEAGVNATTSAATRFVTFAEQASGALGTGVAFANPSNESALVTFTAKNTDGQTLATEDRTLLPGGHDAQNMGPLFGLESFTGSIEVTSTVPIVSLSLNAEASPVISSLPPGEVSAAGVGSFVYFFPHLAVGGEWQTQLTYINVSAGTVTCNTSFFSDGFPASDPGSPLEIPFGGPAVSNRTDEMASGGSIHVESTADANAPTVGGWAQATCTGQVKASLLFRRYSEGVVVAEAGVNAVTTPTTKFVTFAEQATGALGTGVAFTNASLFPVVGITITVFNTAGEQLAQTGLFVFAQSHTATNLGPAIAAAFEEQGIDSFVGAIHIVTTQPVLSLSLNAEASPVISSLPPGDLDPSTPLATSAANPVE